MANWLKRLSIATAVTIFTGSGSFSAFAGKLERGKIVPSADQDYYHPSRYQANQIPNYNFQYKKGIRLYNSGKMGLAEIAFKRALGGSIYYYQANAYLGLTNIKQNDHRSAVHYLKRALKGNPDMYELKATLGLSYVELGKMDKASEVLTQLRKSKNRIIEQGADEDDIQKSITVLEQAIINA